MTVPDNDRNALATTPGNSAGIRDLLRDTALFVTALVPDGKATSIVQVQSSCRDLIRRFAEALHQRGYPDDVRNDAGIAHCGLLDEVALRHFQGDSRAAWELKPLQVEQFGIHDAGERVFDRIEQRLREADARVDLLECYCAVLGLGFMGRFVREEATKRDALVAALNARIVKLRPQAGRPFISERRARRPADWFYRLSPWAIAGLIAVLGGLAWVGWHAGLDVQLANLLSGTPRP